jgi:hypothetical protein
VYFLHLKVIGIFPDAAAVVAIKNDSCITGLVFAMLIAHGPSLLQVVTKLVFKLFPPDAFTACTISKGGPGLDNEFR